MGTKSKQTRLDEATKRQCLARAVEVGTQQAAQEYGVNTSTIRKWRKMGLTPAMPSNGHNESNTEETDSASKTMTLDLDLAIPKTSRRVGRTTGRTWKVRTMDERRDIVARAAVVGTRQAAQEAGCSESAIELWRRQKVKPSRAAKEKARRAPARTKVPAAPAPANGHEPQARSALRDASVVLFEHALAGVNSDNTRNQLRIAWSLMTQSK